MADNELDKLAAFRFKARYDENPTKYFREEFENYLKGKKPNCDFLRDERKAIASIIKKEVEKDESSETIKEMTKNMRIYLMFKMFIDCKQYEFFFYFLEYIYKENILFPGIIISSFLRLSKDKGFIDFMKKNILKGYYTKVIGKIIYESSAKDVAEYLFKQLEKVANREIGLEQTYAIKSLSLIPEKSIEVLISLMDDWDSDVKKTTISLFTNIENKKAALKAAHLYKKENSMAIRALLRQIIMNSKPKEELKELLISSNNSYLIPLLAQMLTKEEAKELSKKLNPKLADSLMNYFIDEKNN